MAKKLSDIETLVVKFHEDDSKERDELLKSLGREAGFFSADAEISDFFVMQTDEEIEEVLVKARKETGVAISADDKIVDVIARMKQRSPAKSS